MTKMMKTFKFFNKMPKIKFDFSSFKKNPIINKPIGKTWVMPTMMSQMTSVTRSPRMDIKSKKMAFKYPNKEELKQNQAKIINVPVSKLYEMRGRYNLQQGKYIYPKYTGIS